MLITLLYAFSALTSKIEQLRITSNQFLAVFNLRDNDKISARDCIWETQFNELIYDNEHNEEVLVYYLVIPRSL